MLASMPRTSKPAPEVFRFAVDDWFYEYGLHLNEKGDRVTRHCWESHAVVLRGALRSPTKRKIDRVELWIHPRDFKPEELPPAKNLIGALYGIRARTMNAFVHVPPMAFQAMLAAVAAGKVKGADIAIVNLRHSDGEVRSFYTVDPDEPLD